MIALPRSLHEVSRHHGPQAVARLVWPRSLSMARGSTRTASPWYEVRPVEPQPRSKCHPRGVDLGGDFPSDIAAMPGFSAVAGLCLRAPRIALDPAEPPGVARQPSRMARACKCLRPWGSAARDFEVDGGPELVLRM